MLNALNRIRTLYRRQNQNREEKGNLLNEYSCYQIDNGDFCEEAQLSY